jgi:hypothetical protein
VHVFPCPQICPSSSAMPLAIFLIRLSRTSTDNDELRRSWAEHPVLGERLITSYDDGAVKHTAREEGVMGHAAAMADWWALSRYSLSLSLSLSLSPSRTAGVRSQSRAGMEMNSWQENKPTLQMEWRGGQFGLGTCLCFPPGPWPFWFKTNHVDQPPIAGAMLSS